MSLSGSSASRNSICAMTRLASSSSMNVGRKMIRSLSRREKMSKARSPRGVCSMTIGTRAMLRLLFQARTTTLRPNGCVLDQEVECLALAEPLAQRLEVATLLHHTPHGGCRPLTGAGDLLDLRIDLVLQLAPLLGLAPRLELAAHLRPQRVEGLELAERLREVVVERGQDFFLH